MIPSPTRITCEAIVNQTPAAYGFLPVRCLQSVAITRWYDASGSRHAACSRHRASLESRFPPSDPPQEHVLIDDGPTLGGASRMTCQRCGRAVLNAGGTSYGSALTEPCDPPRPVFLHEDPVYADDAPDPLTEAKGYADWLESELREGFGR